MKSIVLLGATGSIGRSTLRVVDALPDQLRIVGMSAASQYSVLFELAQKYGVKHVALSDIEAAKKAQQVLPAGLILHSGPEGLVELAELEEADVVVCSVVGMAGLPPTLAAIRAGHDVALATKEVLVAAGELVMAERLKYNVKLLPIDSEHSALFQCLQSSAFTPACVRDAQAAEETFAESRIQTLILTASGGPFFERASVDWHGITVEETLNHPRWKMGAKVTIDSATMMNKGLELIEAHHLYHIPERNIHIWVHPQSIVHSLVQFKDGAYLAQLSPPDMRLPIQFALTWPERRAAPMPELDLLQMHNLTFAPPDETRFPCLGLAREALRCGGSMPAVMNAANEIAVEAFLKRRITGDKIFACITAVMEALPAQPIADEAGYYAIDQEARAVARTFCQTAL